ncbi:MAG: hypothetical protein C4576_11030 [Desulfobacteraceae bacterium]|nr:MAG: hypothetical protein C4576_11030 [Desulfobacteraceae bacterium]
MEPNVNILFAPEDRLMDFLLKEFVAARKSIDIVVYLLGSKTVANAILKAHQRGIVIRMIIDGKVGRTRYSAHKSLLKKSIDVRTLRVTGGSMHTKFTLIDGSKLIAGSANLTNDANFRNHEFMFVSEDPLIFACFSSKFEALWSSLDKQPPASGEGGR